MNAVLKTSQLTKTYSSKQVVKELSMTIQQGDIYGFIGKNGAGKTTLIRMIAGLATPSSGSIELFGSSDLVKGRDTGTCRTFQYRKEKGKEFFSWYAPKTCHCNCTDRRS